MSYRLAVLGLSIAAAFGLMTACGGSDDGGRSSKIFTAPPWQGAEVLEYNLEQKGVDNTASCTLTTAPAGDETTLIRACADNRGYRDEDRVVVDSQTLSPRTATRTVFDAEDKTETTHSVAYDATEARFETRSGDKRRDTTRDLPEPGDESPDPGWYDDGSQLWLVRGITLQEGWEGSYTHVINAGQPRVLDVDVEVEKLETVRVPLGEFKAWKIRVAKEKTVYFFWVEEAAPHRVVRAQVEGSAYELSGSK